MSAVAGDLPGARVADLFAGSGALGLEALSRGAAHAVFVERAAPALRTLHANVATLEAGDRATVVRGDVLRFLDDVDPEWDLAFADPPYGQGLGAALVERFADRPFARLLSVEHGRGDPLPELAGARQRRYGDTVVSFFPAP